MSRFKIEDRVRYDNPAQYGTVTYADEHFFEVTPDPGGKGGIRRFSQKRSILWNSNRTREYPTKV